MTQPSPAPAAATPRVRDVADWKGLNLEFFFATEVLRLRALHYGYWDVPPETPVSLRALRAAQERLTQKLLSYLPEEVRTVLDVGAGVGDISRALAQRGCQVTAVSPDRNHSRYFAPLRRQGVRFHRTYFEDFDSPDRFDLVLISEALNYFEREIGLRQCRRFVRPNGYLLVSAMFRFRDHRPFAEPFHAATLPYVKAAAQFGFRLTDELDITRAVAPTMLLARRAVDRYLIPALRVGTRAARLLAWRRAIEKLRTVQEYYDIRTDPAYFVRSMRYVILRFRRDGDP